MKKDNVDSNEGSLMTLKEKYLHTEKVEESQKNITCWVAFDRSKFQIQMPSPSYVNISFYKHFLTKHYSEASDGHEEHQKRLLKEVRYSTYFQQL